MQEELEWLRYFYKHARQGMGPADSEIYDSIREEYEASGGVVPAEYQPEE